MAAPSVFEFFELIADELITLTPRVITSASINGKHGSSTLLDSLRQDMKATSHEEAIKLAVKDLEVHFKAKGSDLPFSYDDATAQFSALDLDYLKFVVDMKNIRSVGKRSRDFECSVAERLQKRATGWLHRVGFPRDLKKTSSQFKAHLRTLGFKNSILLGKEKDGGLDILWALPLGSIPHRPLLSVQCKNGIFDYPQADASVGAGSRSLSQHNGLMVTVHVPCVLFNDYVHKDMLTQKQMNFVPLGLSDLALLNTPTSLEKL